ncbi:hypothetical protein MLP_08530 [Microlunatus phosphovorus NM-1]|uniref:Uncharacterized protein n=1 Tax=Microlunatus phosphovorus (strain ATCC 700054 / DSM 10555 / JCM 9379 / NBRC 101784 / NCIMB 13414 / VKM Ac-1990 / NM-1) TaxID=1032480 RepID=F5XLY8_MICPN|nr:hypothetical protein MLP_08530 [Microlunatus phosphovorus NM-1]
MLALYRRAIALRRELQTEERLDWLDTESEDVLHLRRPNGWRPSPTSIPGPLRCPKARSC